MSTTETTTGPAVYRAISRVMDEIGRLGMGKDGYNQSQKFAFRGIDQVYEVLNPLMVKHGLMILPRYGAVQRDQYTTKSGGTMFSVSIPGEFDIVCAEDGSKHTVCIIGEGMDTGDKATNKAMSVAYKYAALQIFCIPVKGNDDPDAHSPEGVRMRRSDRERAQLVISKSNIRDAVASSDTVEALESYKRSPSFKAVWARLDEGEKAEIIGLFKDRKADIEEPPLGDTEG